MCFKNFTKIFGLFNLCLQNGAKTPKIDFTWVKLSFHGKESLNKLL